MNNNNVSNGVFFIAQLYEKIVGYNPLTLPQQEALAFIPLARKYDIPALEKKQAQKGEYSVAASAKKTHTANGSPLWRDTANRTGFMPVTIVWVSADGTQTKEFALGHTIVGISAKKKLVETDMTERNGSVIELIHSGNYEISLRGIVVGENGSFPDEDLALLYELYTKNEPVSFRCALTDIFMGSDDSVVIKGFDIPQKQGVEGVREYSLSIVSNAILTLELE